MKLPTKIVKTEQPAKDVHDWKVKQMLSELPDYELGKEYEFESKQNGLIKRKTKWYITELKPL